MSGRTRSIQMAIAFDAATDGGSTTGTSLTFSHTCSGSNRILFVGVRGDTASDTITGVTYNGVAMTLIPSTKHNDGSNRWVYLFYLIAPATGANNVVVSSSSSVLINAAAVSYTGAKQSGVPDASTKNSNASASSLATSLTTILDSCWTVLVGVSNTSQAAGTGATRRTISGDTAFAMHDSNGGISPAGSTSMTITANSGGINTIMVSFPPSTLSQTFTESITTGDSIAKLPKRTLTEALTTSDTFAKLRTAIATFIDNLLLIDYEYALNFQANSHQLVITNSGGQVHDNQSDASYSVWFTPSDVSLSTEFIFAIAAGAGSNRRYILVNSGNLRANVGSIDTLITPVSVNTLYNATLLVDWTNSQWRMYLNNTLVKDWTAFTHGAGNANITIGQQSTGGTQAFRGTINRVRIWNRLLSSTEIANVYNNTPVPSGLIAEWLCMEGSGSTVYDTSGFGHNGAITGATYVQMFAPSIFKGFFFTLGRNLLETTTILDTFAKAGGWFRTLTESVTTSDVFAKAVTHVRTFIESLSIRERIRQYLNGLNSRYSEKHPRRGSSYSSKYPKRGTRYDEKYPGP